MLLFGIEHVPSLVDIQTGHISEENGLYLRVLQQRQESYVFLEVQDVQKETHLLHSKTCFLKSYFKKHYKDT